MARTSKRKLTGNERDFEALKLSRQLGSKKSRSLAWKFFWKKLKEIRQQITWNDCGNIYQNVFSIQMFDSNFSFKTILMFGDKFEQIDLQ